ncbi:hypothetical protein KIP88_03175 [Bradyrhizobium sp. SRL28]|uniref:hypothetical protein n=1 Tax=Bradyrhizobium sp. SRL28 TaxID=2836178 RepID=UPI001BDEE7A1|nr:hypothetical protein [Bradyrhizobium sp. SRL28]MBT1509495.1 hypothetical protein [Bradyrhizobium sp. SRL28]
MTAKDATVREILDAGLSAATAGLDIVKQTQGEQKLAERDEDGPRMKAWLNRHARPAPPPLNNAADMGDVIGCVVASERAGRPVTAGAALVRLRMRYDNLDLPELASDEQSWLAFATKHVPLPAERVAELIGRMVHHGGTMRCTKCGTFTRCACGCGRPYVSEHRWGMPVETEEPVKVTPVQPPSAMERAAAAIAAHPEKSNRVIAAEIDVAEPTVRRARQRIRDAGGDDAVDDAVGRIGRDGRRRRLPGTTASFQLPDPDRDLIQDMHPDAITEEQRWQWSAANAAGDAIAMRAFWSREFGDWGRFKPPPELLTLAQEAVAAWQSLATDLEEGL